jgi:hypothetical protein
MALLCSRSLLGEKQAKAAIPETTRLKVAEYEAPSLMEQKLPTNIGAECPGENPSIHLISPSASDKPVYTPVSRYGTASQCWQCLVKRVTCQSLIEW